jgi:hypothetical protein
MFIEFAEKLQPISGILYWFVVGNALASLLFTLVVTIGGVCDLKFLISALKSEDVDDADNGRVVKDELTGKPITPDQQST